MSDSERVGKASTLLMLLMLLGCLADPAGQECAPELRSYALLHAACLCCAQFSTYSQHDAALADRSSLTVTPAAMLAASAGLA